MPSMAHGDAPLLGQLVDQLDQVLWALLDNAVRHGRASSISVRIAADRAASALQLSVADDGPGITESDRDRLFARYERLAGSAGTDGSGLGLYVSRELCRAMGGDLTLEPAGPEGGGATFAVIVPAEPPEPAEPVESPGLSTDAPEPPGSPGEA